MVKQFYYPNLILEVKNDDKMDVDKNNGQSKTLMFCGHLDVCPILPQKHGLGNRSHWRIDSRWKTWTGGSTDMKGGCVSMLMAMILLKRS